MDLKQNQSNTKIIKGGEDFVYRQKSESFHALFWLSTAVAISFVLSQTYLALFQ